MNTELLKYYKDMQNAYENANKGYNEEIKIVENDLEKKIFELLENAKSNIEQTRLGNKYGFAIKVNQKGLLFYPRNPFDHADYAIAVSRSSQDETIIALNRYGKSHWVTSCDKSVLLDFFEEIKECLTVGVENAIKKDMESMLKEITEKQNKLNNLKNCVA